MAKSTTQEMKNVKGLETEIPAEMEPTAQTLAILLKVEEKGICRFEPDDSPEWQETLKQMREIREWVGYELWKHSSVYYMVDDQNIPSV